MLITIKSHRISTLSLIHTHVNTETAIQLVHPTMYTGKKKC